MAGSTGLEPAASGVTGRRSNQLNYDPAKTVEYIENGARQQVRPPYAPRQAQRMTMRPLSDAFWNSMWSCNPQVRGVTKFPLSRRWPGCSTPT